MEETKGATWAQRSSLSLCNLCIQQSFFSLSIRLSSVACHSTVEDEWGLKRVGKPRRDAGRRAGPRFSPGTAPHKHAAAIKLGRGYVRYNRCIAITITQQRCKRGAAFLHVLFLCPCSTSRYPPFSLPDCFCSPLASLRLPYAFIPCPFLPISSHATQQLLHIYVLLSRFFFSVAVVVVVLCALGLLALYAAVPQGTGSGSANSRSGVGVGLVPLLGFGGRLAVDLRWQDLRRHAAMGKPAPGRMHVLVTVRTTGRGIGRRSEALPETTSSALRLRSSPRTFLFADASTTSVVALLLCSSRVLLALLAHMPY